MTNQNRLSAEDEGRVVKPYEPPRLTLVGNLNDLLAGTGSKDTDNPPACKVNSTMADPTDCQ
jgi:hypothetical protein